MRSTFFHFVFFSLSTSSTTTSSSKQRHHRFSPRTTRVLCLVSLVLSLSHVFDRSKESLLSRRGAESIQKREQRERDFARERERMTGGDGDGGTRARPAPPRPPPLPSVSLTYRDLPPASLAWLREALSAWQAHHLRYFGGGGEAGAGAGAAGSAASAGAPLSSGSLELLLPHLGAPRQQQRQATLPVFADVPVPAARGVDDEAEEAKGRLHPATLRPSPAASRLASRSPRTRSPAGRRTSGTASRMTPTPSAGPSSPSTT